MKGLFGYSGDVLDSGADHFIFFEELGEEGDFGVGELWELTDVGVWVVTVVDLCEGVLETGFFVDHVWILDFNNRLQKV